MLVYQRVCHVAHPPGWKSDEVRWVFSKGRLGQQNLSVALSWYGIWNIPSGNLTWVWKITIYKIYSEFSHEKLWFSILMLVYQRVGSRWITGRYHGIIYHMVGNSVRSSGSPSETCLIWIPLPSQLDVRLKMMMRFFLGKCLGPCFLPKFWGHVFIIVIPSPMGVEFVENTMVFSTIWDVKTTTPGTISGTISMSKMSPIKSWDDINGNGTVRQTEKKWEFVWNWKVGETLSITFFF